MSAVDICIVAAFVTFYGILIHAIYSLGDE